MVGSWGNTMDMIAVIDTETTWSNELMSVGVVIASADDLSLVDSRYYILESAKRVGGLFSDVLYHHRAMPDLEAGRRPIMTDLIGLLDHYEVRQIFAYNARFDQRLLTELSGYCWHDILRLAAYRQYNTAIPADAPCFKTGRLKNGYGVEEIFRMLSGDPFYEEVHNALADAIDELAIMRMLGQGIEAYEIARLV